MVPNNALSWMTGIVMGVLAGAWCLCAEASSRTHDLVPPFDLQWGATPDAVANLLSRVMRPIPGAAGVQPTTTIPPAPTAATPVASPPGGLSDGGAALASFGVPPGSAGPASPPLPVAQVMPAGTSGIFLSEQQYEGEIFAAKAESVVALFFMSRLFGLTASFPAAPDAPASLVWERIVEQIRREYGPPRFRSKPVPLLSWNAVLKVVPPEANTTALLKIYNDADRDPRLGRYILQDLQVQTGLWVPEAVWNFPDGGAIKAVMRATGRNEFGLTAIKPLLIMVKNDMFP